LGLGEKRHETERERQRERESCEYFWNVHDLLQNGGVLVVAAIKSVLVSYEKW
jgi:hypothetical protein